MKRMIPVLLLAAAAACSQESVSTPPKAAPPAPTGDFQPEAKKFLNYTTPAEWVSERYEAGMRKAQYRIPGKGGAGPASLVFFRMATMSEEQLSDYWRNKMGGADAAVSKLEGTKVPTTIVDISGTYSEADPAIENARFLGAMVEVGDSSWYLKFAGPAETVAGWKAEYFAMLKGLRPLE